MTTDNECCGDCKFWKHVPDRGDSEHELIGICCRYPPVSVLTDTADIEADEADPWEGRAAHDFCYWAQPRVLENDWCGEFRVRDLTT